MKTIYSHKIGNEFKSFLAIDEQRDERKQLEIIKKIIDIYLEDDSH